MVCVLIEYMLLNWVCIHIVAIALLCSVLLKIYILVVTTPWYRDSMTYLSVLLLYAQSVEELLSNMPMSPCTPIPTHAAILLAMPYPRHPQGLGPLVPAPYPAEGSPARSVAGSAASLPASSTTSSSTWPRSESSTPSTFTSHRSSPPPG